MSSDDFLRVVAAVLWVAVVFFYWRTEGPRRHWPVQRWYVFVTAVFVALWRVLLAVRYLFPGYVPSDLFKFVIREITPSLYIMLAFAVVLSARSPRHDG